jgi:hypothetical protein
MWSAEKRKTNQESRNRGNGITEIEGKAVRVAARERGGDQVSKQERKNGKNCGLRNVDSGKRRGEN